MKTYSISQNQTQTDYLTTTPDGCLALERHYHVSWTKFQNPSAVVESAREKTLLPEGFAWAAVSRPALVARAVVTDSAGGIIAPRSVVDATIAAAERAEEHALAECLRSKLA